MAALVLHALFIAALLVLAWYSVALTGVRADSARGGGLLALVLFAGTLLPGVPSLVALLSWWICRRRGWAPSDGHMKLTIAGIGVLCLIMALGIVL